MKDWKELLKAAEHALRNKGVSNWVFGGGTALMHMFNHRRSKDIDIFVSDLQYLSYLSPRLNDETDRLCGGDYTEASSFVKLRIGEQEIDFIAALNLTGVPPRKDVIGTIDVQVESPDEIVVKKIFYRAESFKARDIFDLATALDFGVDLYRHIDIFKGRLGALEDRVAFLEPHYAAEIAKLDIIRHDIAAIAMDKGKDFIGNCKSVLLRGQARGGPKR